MSPVEITDWPGFYHLHDPSASKMHQALEHLAGYYKTTSMINLRVLGLPVLKGVIVTRWDATVRHFLDSFCESHGFSKLLVRTDKRQETGIYMRGGYLIDVNELDTEVSEILKLGRIVILLEPRSPYKDLYSLNAMFTPEDADILLEVVGPGFDASDLKRGDISPHEVIRLPRPRFIGAHTLVAENITRTIVDDKSYKSSIKFRLAKIGRIISGEKNLSNKQLETLAREHLQATGQTLLIENEKRYRPIPFPYLENIYRLIADLPERAKDLKIQSEPMVVSMSFFAPDEALAFWDIVWPAYKYAIPAP